MPVELEGYIRPGCIILTVFVAMPRFMWMKVIAYRVISIELPVRLMIVDCCSSLSFVPAVMKF